MSLAPIHLTTFAGISAKSMRNCVSGNAHNWPKKCIPILSTESPAQSTRQKSGHTRLPQKPLPKNIRRDEATGLPEATDRANEACAMEAEARAALTAHRPANAAEAKMKADYMESAASSWNYCWDEPGFREALVARLCEVA